MSDYSVSEVPAVASLPGKCGPFIEKLKNLCLLILDIVKTRSEMSIVENKYNPIFQSLLSYKVFLERTPYLDVVNRHMSRFHEIVCSNIEKVMTGLSVDDLSDLENPIVIYCNGDRASPININLTIAMNIVRELKTMFDEDNTLVEASEIEYPRYYKFDEAIILYFYRCLECIDFGPYNTRITAHVNRLEISVGLKKRSVPSSNPLAGLGDMLGGNGEGIGNVVKMAMKMAGDMGIAPPEGADNLTEETITEGLTKIISHKDTKDMMNSMNSAFSGNPEDIGQMLPNLLNTLMQNKDKISNIAEESGIDLGVGTSGSAPDEIPDEIADTSHDETNELLVFSDDEDKDVTESPDEEVADSTTDIPDESIIIDETFDDDFDDDDIVVG